MRIAIRFSIAGLLVAVGLVAVVLAVVTNEIRRVKKTNALHEAVSRRDYDRVKVLLGQGYAVDQVNEDRVFGFRIRTYPYSFENGVTPLYVAVCKSDLQTVRLLLERGANINHSVHSPYSILQRAVTQFFPTIDFHGSGGLPQEEPEEVKLEIVRLLIDAGVNVDERKYDGGETAIEMCERVELPKVKQLLEAKSAPSSLQIQTSN